MLKVGITGGIGSGKTTVCRIFELLGIPVYYADTMARDIMNRDPALKEQVIQHFGTDIYDSQGLLNRQRLGGIVFNDQEKLQTLNSLVHPATIRDSEAWAARQKAPYVLKEAALLFESEAFHYLDKIVGVSAPQPLRLLRAMQRDKADRNEILARMYKQMDETIKMRLCDYVIYNDEQQMVIPQVLALHKELLVASERSL